MTTLPLRSFASSSRTLCLLLQPRETKIRVKDKNELCDAFLRFSPRVQWREADAHLGALFIDIASTSALFDGEELLLSSAVSLAEQLGFNVKAAISDTPSGACALASSLTGLPANSPACSSESHLICQSGEERETLQRLSLPLLFHLQGLEAWAQPTIVQQMISHFFMLGFDSLGDLLPFSFFSFKERWGETGAVIWRRLHGLERQVVSPFVPESPLQQYVYLDFPVSVVSLLFHNVQQAAEILFARLQGRRLFARKLVLNLRCEYSETKYKIEIEPHSPSRDLALFLTLLDMKLDNLDLENPIRDFEIEVEACPEKIRQLDFFEPRNTAHERLDKLINLLHHANIHAGLFKITPALLPENSYQFEVIDMQKNPDFGLPEKEIFNEPPPTTIDVGEHTTDLLHRQLASSRIGDDVSLKAKSLSPPKNLKAKKKAWGETETGLPQVQVLPHYSEAIMTAPRPTRLLLKPRPLSEPQFQELRLLSRKPLERIEARWWPNEATSENAKEKARDYYLAINSHGQCLWVYEDLKNKSYFLHGYFD